VVAIFFVMELPGTLRQICLYDTQKKVNEKGGCSRRSGIACSYAQKCLLAGGRHMVFPLE
jgi:hypothetical protein